MEFQQAVSEKKLSHKKGFDAIIVLSFMDSMHLLQDCCMLKRGKTTYLFFIKVIANISRTIGNLSLISSSCVLSNGDDSLVFGLVENWFL